MRRNGLKPRRKLPARRRPSIGRPGLIMVVDADRDEDGRLVIVGAEAAMEGVEYALKRLGVNIIQRAHDTAYGQFREYLRFWADDPGRVLHEMSARYADDEQFISFHIHDEPISLTFSADAQASAVYDRSLERRAVPDDQSRDVHRPEVLDITGPEYELERGMWKRVTTAMAGGSALPNPRGGWVQNGWADDDATFAAHVLSGDTVLRPPPKSIMESAASRKRASRKRARHPAVKYKSVADIRRATAEFLQEAYEYEQWAAEHGREPRLCAPRDLQSYIKRHVITPLFKNWVDYSFYGPRQWAAKGETMCSDATLTLAGEGGLFHALNGYGDPSWDAAIYELFGAVASACGYKWEQGFHWTAHFYPKTHEDY